MMLKSLPLSVALSRLLICAGVLLSSETMSASAATSAHVEPTGSAPQSELFNHLSWRLLGPFRGGWAEMAEGVPSQPDTFYFGAAGGGVWRSDNAGRTWDPVFDRGPAAPVGALAVAPSDPQTIYIGTGQPEPRYDVASGAGVFKSVDGGKNWSSLGLEATQTIGKIWVNPKDANTVLVGAVGHFFGANSERGVYRSADGGKSWQHVLQIDNDTGVVDIAADPAQPETIFAAAWQARQYPWQSYFTKVAGPGSGIYKSVDGGQNWQRLQSTGWPTGALGRISIATTRTANGLRLYATISDTAAGGLYRSDDGGASWQRVNDGSAFTSYYASRVTVAPDNPDVVYLVGQSVRRCSEGGKTCKIWRGAPGGDDFHHVWINPLHPDHIAASSDQGAIISVDGGQTWSSWLNQPTGQFYRLATDNQFPYWIYSGQQDSGSVGIASRSDYGSITQRDWHPVGADERDFAIPDPDDFHIVYGTGLGGRVSRWDARTGQVAGITPSPLPNYGMRQTDTRHHFAWVTPMAVSRTGPFVLYVGGEVLFASTDRGEHWNIISPDLTGKSQTKVDGKSGDRCGGDVALADAKTCGYGSIWTIAASARHVGEIWVGTDDGLVQVTRDGGRQWKNVTPPGVPEWTKIASMDLSDIEDGVAYIALDGHRLDNLRPMVMRTRDYGAHWVSIGDGLPDHHFVHVVRADPKRAGLLFAGTDIGAYVSLDDGAHWNALQRNLPTVQINDLHIHGNDLIAATQGRAIWVMDNMDSLRQIAPDQLAQNVLFKPVDAIRMRANHNRDTPTPQEEPMGQNPPLVTFDYWLARSSAKPVTIQITDAAGNAVQTLSSVAAERPEAERYFSTFWIKPQAVLDTTPGMHRASWNLRYPRPQAISYDYSIAASPGVDTPIKPEGMLVLPGTYHVVLTVDGQRQQSTLTVRQDPRSKASLTEMREALALSKQITGLLETARRGFGEIAFLRDQCNSTLEEVKSRPDYAALKASSDAFLNSLHGLEVRAAFEKSSKTLTGIENDLEDADRGPNQPQRETVREVASDIARGWADWNSSRDKTLDALNQIRQRAGLSALVIPSADKLDIEPKESGEDLP